MDRYNAEGYQKRLQQKPWKISCVKKKQKAINLAFYLFSFCWRLEKNLNEARKYLKFAVEQGTVTFCSSSAIPTSAR